MLRLLALIGLAMASGVVLPSGTDATSLHEVQKLLASEPHRNDDFGYSVTLSGDTAVIGAWLENGVGDNSGAAYVFTRNSGGSKSWDEVTRLIASDPQAGDRFGWTVAVSGDTAVVGACCEDERGDDAGAAYVFERNEGGPNDWAELTKLTASDAEAGDFFGWSAAVENDIAVVGARFKHGEAGIGAAYVFERQHGGENNWGEIAKLTPFELDAGDDFGVSVAVNGDTIIVGGCCGEGEDDNPGAAYIFQRDVGDTETWNEVAELRASDGEPNDVFGWSIAASADVAVVGAHGEDAGGENAGAVYIFERDQGGPDNWGEIIKLTASDAEDFDLFGQAVSVSQNTIVIGAHREDSAAEKGGAAYVFQRNANGSGNWGEVTKLTASDAEEGDLFGFSVAVSGGISVVGSYRDDTGAASAGAAYIFDLEDVEPKDTPVPTDTPTSVATVMPTPTAPATPKVRPDFALGDANCDEVVNTVDAVLILQLVSGLLKSISCESAADVDGDGDVTSVDATLVLQLTAGLLADMPR